LPITPEKILESLKQKSEETNVAFTKASTS
jgi:hypothetical protein